MPPNTVEIPFDEPRYPNPESKTLETSVKNKKYGFHIAQASLNMVGRLCVGIVVGFCMAFAFRFGLPLNATNQHIVLCVIGYHLLMAEACLALAPGSWTSNFTLVDKRRVHWVLQCSGSILAIAGSIIKSLDNNVNWGSLHGKFALVAMVFTTVSLVNGLASLYSYELRRFIPANLSKLTHILFGAVAFVTACVSLVYGMDKNGFRNWIGVYFQETLVGILGVLTVVVIVNPLLTFAQKSLSIIIK